MRPSLQNSSIDIKAICELFSSTFFKDYRTILVGGYAEPFYLAPQGARPAEIRFTKDYLRSALHEVAHWCVASRERRLQDDLGYWYAPDGRNQEQQQIFYRVEVLPQAYECAFCCALNIDFDVSLDNLAGEVEGGTEFRSQVRAEFLRLHESNGFPQRAQRWIDALLKHDDTHAANERRVFEWLDHNARHTT